MRTTLLRTLCALALLATPLSSQALYWPQGVPKTGTATTLPKPPVVRRSVRQNNPRGSEALRNEQRKKDLTTIGNAIFSYKRDNAYKLPAAVPFFDTEICRSCATSCKGLVDLSALAEYLTTVPADPQSPAGNGTGYRIRKDWVNRVFLTAPNAELGWSIRLQK
jgi:hypothetical protein